MSRSSAAAAARHAGRRSSAVMRDAAAGNIRCSGSHVRALSSSPFPDLPAMPESIREAVKSSVLEEAARPDSSFWRGDDSDDQRIRQTQQQRHMIRRDEGTPSHVSAGRANANGAHDRATATATSINDPIAHDRQKTSPTTTPTTNSNLDPHPLIHFDPLDEWHLDRAPSLPLHSLPAGVRPITDGADPFALAKSDLDTLSASIRRDLIGRDHADHPVLAKAAAHFFELGAQGGGKKVRPMMVMLLSRAMASCDGEDTNTNNMATTPAAKTTVNGTATASIPPPQPKPWQRQDLPDAQRRLAEISEMIHTASLFHDDVIDGADTRRGAPAVHRVFGNKMAILAGDYLLARASIYLARLRDVEVVETMSTIIEHLVRGEVMQSHGGGSGSGTGDDNVSHQHEERMVYYLRKNFYKTGSLMANSCKSAALLGGYDDAIVHAAYCYGKHVGSAFQLVDDVLDFDGSSSTMGKASLADLNAGLATAPVLFAAERFPDEMDRLIDRKFGEIGDVNRAVELVRQSDGIQRTKDLAHVYVELAINAVMELEPSPYRDSLIHLAYKVIDRVR